MMKTLKRLTDREIMVLDMEPATCREVATINIRLASIAASYRTTVAKMRKICAPVKKGLYREKIILWLMRDGR